MDFLFDPPLGNPDRIELVGLQGNIVMVLSGHVGTETDGAGTIVSTGASGQSVYQMMANYQYHPWSDSGYLRLLRFSPAAREITVDTYSPSLDVFKTDSDNHFVIPADAMFPSI